MIDLHQHLWPERFLAALRARTRSPRLEGWTLELGDAVFMLDPAAHDVGARAALAAEDGVDLGCVAPCAALGIDRLPRDEASALATVWNDGALELPAPFRAWAAAPLSAGADRAADVLADALDRGAIGLELAADVLAAPGALDRLAPLLDVLDAAGRPLFVHPGPPPAAAAVSLAGTVDAEPYARPAWWTPTVADVAALHAAWWAWADGGRDRFSDLPVVFAALAGLAPLHGERHRARGGLGGAIDTKTYVETSSYGAQAVDAVIRVLGIDVVCHGSDRPEGTAAALRLDPSATHALRRTNPERLLAHALQEVRA